MRLEQALARIATERDEHLAVSVVGGGSLTYGELHARATHYAAALQASGIVEGDRVGIVSRHNAEAIALFWGILTAGAIVVWMNDDAKGKDLPAVCASADPKLIVVQGEKQQRLFANNDEMYERVMELEVLAGMAVLPPEPITGDDTDPAVIVYTSGSSGRPKGVCLSHKNLYTVDRSVIEHMPITPEDIYLMVVPLHYVHGIMQLTVHLLAGATLHFHDSFLFPAQVVDALVNLRCTGFSGVPFHFNALMTRGSLLDRELPDLRWVTVTGGKLPADAILTILDRFPELEFHIAYGQTECAPRATALKPDRIRRKPDSVGSPIPNVTVEIIGDDNTPVPQGQKGEVVVSGDNIMLGYWNDPETTAEAIDDQGRLRTGDIGYFDDEGDLFLVGRRSAMIKSAGERIVPEEIERVLDAHPSVMESVVIGVPDDMLGQRVVAHVRVEAQAGLDDTLSAELRTHCLRTIPLPRAPREFHLCRDFPRKANGKPDRVALANLGAEDA